MKHTLTLLTALLLAPLAAQHAADAPKQRPNILLITADDLGLQLSCYGEKNIGTPHLDRLAAEGVRFANGYVAQASCSSSRAALLTGKWPHQNGQVGLAHLGFTMHPGQRTLPALLKAAGYRTGIIGKLHVEPESVLPFDWKPAKSAPGGARNVQWIAEQSRAFIAGAKQAGQPFFYYVNYFDPHGPLNAETDQVNGLPEKPIAAADVRETIPVGDVDIREPKAATARLLNTVLRIDAGIGLLLDELKRAGVAENTLVMFVGDNGVATPRGKTTSYELGLRVPFLVRWPGTAKPGQVREELVSLLDIMPTVLDATGLQPPDGLAGRALQPLMRGEQAAWREYLFSEMNFHTPDFVRLQRSVRDGRHKLLLTLNPRANEPRLGLYDLRDDPWEKRNLVHNPALAPVKQKLEAALLQWRQETADPLLDDARAQRWIAAAKKWGSGPREKVGNKRVVSVPPGDLKLLE